MKKFILLIITILCFATLCAFVTETAQQTTQEVEVSYATGADPTTVDWEIPTVE